MAFTDPVSLTIDGTAYSLPRTSTSGNRGRYSTADGLIAVTADHQYGSRYRHVLRIDHSKVTPDPFIPAQNSKVGMNHYLIFDYPPGGYTNTEVLKVYQGFKTWFTASSDAIITKLLGGES